MSLRHKLPLALACLAPGVAAGQTGFVAPDGRNRFPAVTIFCPSGTGVAPCNFGSGGGGAGGGLTVGGQPVSPSNRLPVSDLALDALVSGGALSITGTVGLAGSPSVSLGAGTLSVGSVAQSGLWTMALAAGNNAIGSVSVSNLPAVQPISGAISQSGSWTVGLAAGSNDIGLVDINSLPALAAGTNAIGSVAVTNFPASQPISGAVSQAGSWTVALGSGASVGLSAGTNAIGSVAVTNLPATQAISGAVSQAGSWTVALGSGATVGLAAGANAVGSVSVSNLPATQAISAATLPLPNNAATASAQAAVLGPVAPGIATATNSVVIGCLANTTLPSFNAGQQGAVPCDTSGRPYVVTVPSANNVPTYLQAVTTGGATIYRAINAAASAMAASLKSASGMVYGYEACNSGTAAAYLRLFALPTAPTIGTSTPAVTKLLSAGSCQAFSLPLGLMFPTGIAMDVTAGNMSDADAATITAANQVSVEVYYK